MISIFVGWSLGIIAAYKDEILEHGTLAILLTVIFVGIFDICWIVYLIFPF